MLKSQHLPRAKSFCSKSRQNSCSANLGFIIIAGQEKRISYLCCWPRASCRLRASQVVLCWLSCKSKISTSFLKTILRWSLVFRGCLGHLLFCNDATSLSRISRVFCIHILQEWCMSMGLGCTVQRNRNMRFSFFAVDSQNNWSAFQESLHFRMTKGSFTWVVLWATKRTAQLLWVEWCKSWRKKALFIVGAMRWAACMPKFISKLMGALP